MPPPVKRANKPKEFGGMAPSCGPAPKRTPLAQRNGAAAGKKDVASKVDCGNRNKEPKDKESSREKQLAEMFSGPDHALATMLMKDVVQHSPSVTWDTIAGLEDAKRVLEEAVVWPLWKPNMFKGIRRPPKGVLLFGPPGTGKTLLAKAVATECKTTFFSVSSSTLASKFRGDSERMVKILFEMARKFAPSTIFVDEIDSLCSSRSSSGEHEASRRVKTEFLVQIDGCNAGGEEGKPAPYVMVLAATNYPWQLDEALRRRMEKRIFINLPNMEQRKRLVEINLEGLKLKEDCSLANLAERMEGYSGDDCSNVCRDAAMNGLRRMMSGRSKDEIMAMETANISQDVTSSDFDEALKRIHPSVGKDDVVKHDEWMKEFGSS